MVGLQHFEAGHHHFGAGHHHFQLGHGSYSEFDEQVAGWRSHQLGETFDQMGYPELSTLQAVGGVCQAGLGQSVSVQGLFCGMFDVHCQTCWAA